MARTSKRAIRPGFDDLEGRQLLSTLPETSDFAPAMAYFNGKIYIAWTGTNGDLNVESSSNGRTFGNKVTLPETSNAGPALASFDGRLDIAWTGTDGRLNDESSSDGKSFGRKVTLPETSNAGPALASFGGRLDIAWTGTDSSIIEGGDLNVESSSNGKTFDSKVTLPERSFVGPALASFGGRLDIAWTGDDSHLNVESSSNGKTFDSKVTLPETSYVDPALASFGGYLDIAWTGTNYDIIHPIGGSLNVESSSNGKTFGNNHTLSETSFAGPALASLDGHLYIAWTGDDNRLNVTTTPG